MQVETQNSVESQQDEEKHVTADKQKQHAGDEEIQDDCEGSETAKSSEFILRGHKVHKNCGENKESTNHY